MTENEAMDVLFENVEKILDKNFTFHDTYLKIKELINEYLQFFNQNSFTDDILEAIETKDFWNIRKKIKEILYGF